MAPCHPQIHPILLSTEYKSLHFLNPAFPDLVLYAPTTSATLFFTLYLCSVWNILPLHPGLLLLILQN